MSSSCLVFYFGKKFIELEVAERLAVIGGEQSEVLERFAVIEGE